MINRKQFSRGLAKEAGLTYEDSERVTKALFKYLAKLLWTEGEEVMITGFGAFRHRLVKQRRVRHPATGEMMEIPDKDVVKFYPSEMLSCNSNADEVEADEEETEEGLE